MEPLNPSPSLKKMPVTTLGEQYRRQRKDDAWRPRGFERYQYQSALLNEMPVLGGPDDRYGANPDRYRAL